MTTPCRIEPSLWFSDDIDELTEAATRCQSCELIATCRPLGDSEVHGVWGGVIVGGAKVKASARNCTRAACGNEFSTTNPRQKYCSRYCGDQVSREASEARKVAVVRVCAREGCGVEFETKRDTRFCSRTCVNLARAAKHTAA